MTKLYGLTFFLLLLRYAVAQQPRKGVVSGSVGKLSIWIDNTPRPAPAPVAPPSISRQPAVNVAEWLQVGNTIQASGDVNRGSALAMSSDGTVLALGARLNNGQGHVRVYVDAGAAWDQIGVDLDEPEPNDFGFSVALSANGNILAVGARLADGVNGPNSGQVHVYRWNGSSWEDKGPPIDGEAAGDQFGVSLALSDDGNILAAGAWANDAGGPEAGHVRVFVWTGADWNQRGDDLDGSSAGDQFGDSVALSSDGSVVACGGDQPSNSGSGYVRIYGWNGSGWIQRGSTLSGSASGDLFGESLSLSRAGTVVAVGAPDGNYVTVYRYDGTDWFPIGQTIQGVAAGNEFGSSLSLSADGGTIVIGGRRNGGALSSGHALVYRLSSNDDEWVRVGQELAGSAFDQFGSSASISDDGSRIAIGAQQNGGRGYVQVFDLA